MPLLLKSPLTLKIDTVRITSFTVNVAPPSATVSYARGYTLGEKFVALDTGTATFESAAIPGPDSSLYKSIKSALYELLQPQIGKGEIE